MVIFMRKAGALSTAVIFIIGMLAGIVAYPYVLQYPGKFERQPVQQPGIAESSATLFIPAIDNEGNGVVMPLVVEKRKGRGETLININNLVFWSDTQQSIQTAREVAERFVGMNTGGVDIVYIVDTQSALLEGPSAGAALTIATIAALKDRLPNKSVMITGTIDPDGSIGPVGAILEKAKAAKAVGAELFLVPEGESLEISEQPVQTCSVYLSITYCRTTYRRTVVNVSESAGLPVKEVGTIRDAEKYFFG